jgi:hypothetical protein
LKNDDSEYVRKSVANHLNDISKDHPELALQIGTDWYGKTKETNWVVKHGLRTLLKKGNKEALAIFGFDNAVGIRTTGLSTSAPSIKIGDYLFFEFKLSNDGHEEKNIRLEYTVHYVKANGQHSKKVFQLSEFSLKPKFNRNFKRKQWFKNLSTRRHYPGVHKITLVVNGDEKESVEFELMN